MISMEALAIPLLLFVGSLLALQAGANVQLSGAVGSPIGASTLQLAIAAGLLLALTVAAGTLGAFGALADAEPAHLWGGIGSAVYITAGILLFPRVGALVAVGLFIAGQMGASLLLDGSGWLGVERESLGVSALAGALAVVAGTWMIVRAQAGADSLDAAPRNRSGWLAVGLAAGAALPVQGAVNAQLRADVDAPITVGAFSFLVATATMAAVLAAVLASGLPASPSGTRLRDVPWWGWLGGACGAIYVTSVFVLIPEIGVAPTVALTVAGQQVASVFVDRHGLLRLPRRPISRPRLTGVVLLLAGVALIQLA
jgi:transporter family-2 protein